MTNPPVMGSYLSTVQNSGGSPSTETGPNASVVGASILAIAIFFLIAFASNAILSSITIATFGITVTLSLLTFMGIIILILFVL